MAKQDRSFLNFGLHCFGCFAILHALSGEKGKGSRKLLQKFTRCVNTNSVRQEVGIQETRGERDLLMVKKPHRATGAPRGRPPSLPFDLGEQILAALERRMDPATRTVRPDWKGLARELHVSRSTISREVASLKRSGFIESIAVPVRPGSKISYILYKLIPRPVHIEPSPDPLSPSIGSHNSLA